MKQEFKVVLVIMIISLVLGSFVFYLKQPLDDKTVSPFSSQFDLLKLFGLGSRQKHKNVVYGYLPYWSIAQKKYMQYDKLTDIAYFGLYMEADGSIRTKDDEGNIDPGYNNWHNNKDLDSIIRDSKKHGVRFALTIINHEDDNIDKFLACRSCWDTLAANLDKEMDDKEIRDLNINFEHAAYTTPEVSKQFSEFVKFMKEHLNSRYSESFLVVASFADSAVKDRVSSDLGELTKYADGIFIMAYDFHRPESEYAGPVSPILNGVGSERYDITMMLADYLSQSPPNKLILGVPYYGYNWLVESEDPGSRRIEGSDETGFSESQPYDTIATKIDEDNIQVKWDERGQVPYFTYRNLEKGTIRQVYFENPQSLNVKYDLVQSNKLLGVGIWALGYDGDRRELWDTLKRFK